jgi:WD40 repeat protein
MKKIIMIKHILWFTVLFILLPNICVKAQKKINIVETGSYASCFVYQLQDEKGNKIKVPSVIDSALNCPSGLISVSPDSKYFVFFHDALKIYDFSSKKITVLFDIPENSDGFSDVCWSPDGSKFIFINVNQQLYQGGCKIFVVVLNQGKFEKKYTFEAPVNYVCGSFCTSAAGYDFWFKNNQEISYKRNINIETRPGETETIQLPDTEH